MDYSVNYKELGSRIRQARKSRGVTQEKLGELCSLSSAHIGHIERGSRIPSIDTLYKISVALSVSIDELLSGSPKSPDAALIAIASSLKDKDKAKVRTFVSAVKALADNIDEL